MRRRLRYRQGPLVWALLALFLLIVWHWMFGSHGKPPSSLQAFSGQVLTVSGTTVTVGLAKTRSEPGGTRESLTLTPSTRVVMAGPSLTNVPRALLEAGSRVYVTAAQTRGRWTATKIAIQSTVLSGRITSLGPGDLRIAVTGVSAPVTVRVTAATVFRFPTANPSLMKLGSPASARVTAGADAAWTATNVRLGPA